MIRTTRLACLLLISATPLAAFAEQPCTHSSPQQLKLDLQGAKAVVFEVESHDLVIDARPGAAAELKGRACASDENLLKQLSLTQRKQGDKLIVTLHREQNGMSWFGGSRYAYLDLSGTLPDTIPVQLKVGSGDAELTGASVVSVDVGSGDAHVRKTRGLVAAQVGSGDVTIEDAGSLNLISVSSGDATARDIRGEVRVGSISSGDFELHGARGPVRIGTIGSGDASVSGVEGDVEVESIGSGGVEAKSVRGNLTVRSIGSGGVDHSDIGGQVRLPAEH